MAPGTEEPAPDWAALDLAPEARGAPANADEGLAKTWAAQTEQAGGPREY